MAKKIIIVGGVAGGATAATRLRRLNETDEIILIEKGAYISFANCGLPYHLGGVIKDREELLVQTVSGLNARFNLDVRIQSVVTKIDPAAKTITVTDQVKKTSYQETFDTLILATGAKAIQPAIPGLDTAQNVFHLKTIPDMDHIKQFISQHQVQTATIIGGGFIGIETMENLAALGLKVQLVEQGRQVMPNFDFEMSQQLHAQIKLHQVSLFLNDGLQQVSADGQTLTLSSGQTLHSDLTILAIGVTPESTLAKESGLALGVKGAIKVNQQLETSAKDIYAIGDVIEVVDFVNGQPTHIPLAWPANRQGRLVADIINGGNARYTATQGTSVAKVFELTASSTGNNEQTLKRLGIDYQVLHIHPSSHASYYPNASPIALKLLFAPDGKILGAQAIGTEGVEKRIDVIATAMKFGASAPQLASIELAYAPPYASAKDPVNMLGYVADNLLTGKVATIQWHEVDQLVATGAFFLDVRDPEELLIGQIPGSLNIPLNALRDQLDQLPKDQTLYIYCQVGLRGYNAARLLTQRGFTVKNLDGGFKTYHQAHFKVKVEAQTMEKTNVNNEDGAQNAASGIQTKAIQVDACGLQCPGPILKVKENIDQLQTGDQLTVTASDFGFSTDVVAWAKATGNTILSNEIAGNNVVATIQKGSSLSATSTLPAEGVLHETKAGATMIVFSGDLDKAVASMIIASGAAAMGKKVTIFFTFWGLSVLKKQKVKKRGLAKMFDLMLPNEANSLPVSNMNMGGLGAKMIKAVMKQKNVDPLPLMIQKANDLGVKFVACTMSMDIMGIERDELFDFVEFGGVTTYLGDAEQANLNLFI
jgi:NADPH-dependent 2,4-dienoyl-CoA reductase/sulfur reductase-like enzyme/peroxiredoxin family protein/rhodanese-related sulfurtransferase/TusA-related sulfurtransferase